MTDKHVQVFTDKASRDSYELNVLAGTAPKTAKQFVGKRKGLPPRGESSFVYAVEINGELWIVETTCRVWIIPGDKPWKS